VLYRQEIVLISRKVPVRILPDDISTHPDRANMGIFTIDDIDVIDAALWDRLIELV